MAKGQIEFEKFEGKELDELMKVAISNHRKLSKQSLTELSIEIAYKCIMGLTPIQFEGITGLKAK
jgi:hypothetical protein